MQVNELEAKFLQKRWAEEIGRAIANAKQTAEDKRLRREWWRAGEDHVTPQGYLTPATG